jgi:hypothetical protein
MSASTETLILGFIFGIITVVICWGIFQGGYELGKEHCVAYPSECVAKPAQGGKP